MPNRARYAMRWLLAFGAVAVLTGCGEPSHEFRLLTPSLPFDQDVAAELVEVFERHSNHTITLVPVPETAGSALDLIESGQADLAFASNAQAYRRGITTVMPIYPTVLHILHKRGREAGDLRSFLAGASVFAGPPGSASRLMIEQTLASLEMTGDIVDAIGPADDLPDIIMLYMPLSPDEISARIHDFDVHSTYQLTSLGAPEDIGTGSEIDRALLFNPRLSPFVIPVGTYGDLTPTPVVTLAVDKLLVARPGLPDTAVYDLINEIRRLQPALSADRPLLFEHLSDEFDSPDSTFVLHPGAQAFARRDAPDFYERYSGIAEVLVTLVIGLVSGTYAVVQIYHRRRKNRIDRFYGEAMSLRDSVAGTDSDSDRKKVVTGIKELQDEAYRMLVDEKLAADESFRIFITLSNDIIASLSE